MFYKLQILKFMYYNDYMSLKHYGSSNNCRIIMSEGNRIEARKDSGSAFNL